MTIPSDVVRISVNVDIGQHDHMIIEMTRSRLMDDRDSGVVRDGSLSASALAKQDYDSQCREAQEMWTQVDQAVGAILSE